MQVSLFWFTQLVRPLSGIHCDLLFKISWVFFLGGFFIPFVIFILRFSLTDKVCLICISVITCFFIMFYRVWFYFDAYLFLCDVLNLILLFIFCQSIHVIYQCSFGCFYLF